MYAGRRKQAIPRAPPEPLGDFVQQSALKRWDRQRGLVPASDPYPLADLYAAWDEDAVYVGLIAMDVAEDALYRDRQVPEEDRMLWRLHPGENSFEARLGASRDAAVVKGTGKLVCVPDNGRGVWTLAAWQVPAAEFGKTRLQAGDKVDLHATLTTWGRAQTMEWRETLRLLP